MRLVITLLALLCSRFLSPEPTSAVGTWLTADREARVEITRQGDTYTGKYVGFRDPAASRKQGYEVGMVVLKDLQAKGNALSGQVFDVESKKTYQATLIPKGPDKLELRVTVMGMTAHSEVWTRLAAAPPAKTRP